MDPYRIKVKIHPSNLYQFVICVEETQTENPEVFNRLVEIVVAELEVRGLYFQEFSDQINF